MDRPRQSRCGALGGSDGTADQRAPVRVLAGPALGYAYLVEQAYRVAVELDLVDRLARSGGPQLRGTVCGEEQQRDAGLVGLEHRGVQVGGRRTRRGHDRDHAAGDLGQPEGEEPGRPLVDAYVQPQPARDVSLVQGERQRRRA